MSERITVIPPDAIIALSKTHSLFQNDKIILSEEAAHLIANIVELRIKQIIQMARRFMLKSIRPALHNALTPSDVRNALRTLNMKNLDGYSNCYDYRYVWATKLYKGDRVIKRESCYHNSLGDKCWGRYRLSDIVQQDMQKAVPAAPGLTVHWMVVNGRVPVISSCLSGSVTEEFEKRMQNAIIKNRIVAMNCLDYSETMNAIDNVDTLVKSFKSVESDLKSLFTNNNIERSILDAINKQIVDDKSTRQNKVILPKIDHLLTKEHRFFLKEIRNTIRRASYSVDNEVQTQFKKVIGILKSSLALDQLLPELCHFFVTEMARYNSNPSSMNISILLEYVDAITSNSKLQLHHHVHQLLAPLLKILLNPDEHTPSFIYRGLLLRRYAAQCATTHDDVLSDSIEDLQYPTLRELDPVQLFYLSFTLSIFIISLVSWSGLESIDGYLMSLYKNEILNENCSLSVLYGALCGISNLPLAAKRAVFYPMVPLLLHVVIKKQLNICTCYVDPNTKQYKTQQLKFIICQEIVHLIMGIIYNAGFEDILSTIEDTGNAFTISHQAKTMVNETLLGCVDSSINPECFLPVYTALLCKCFGVLASIDPVTSLKRKICDVSNSEEQLKPNVLPEIRNIKIYVSLYKRANKKARGRPANLDSEDLEHCNNSTIKPWYNDQAIHSLTLLI